MSQAGTGPSIVPLSFTVTGRSIASSIQTCLIWRGALRDAPETFHTPPKTHQFPLPRNVSNPSPETLEFAGPPETVQFLLSERRIDSPPGTLQLLHIRETLQSFLINPLNLITSRSVPSTLTRCPNSFSETPQSRVVKPTQTVLYCIKIIPRQRH